MQAILTKYIGPTNARGARIKASCDRGSVTIPYPHELSGAACHVAAADALVAKFAAEDLAKGYTGANVWQRPRVCGGLPDGTYAHVYVYLDEVTPILKTWSVEAGRGLCRDGVRVATVGREVDDNHNSPTSPSESDDLVMRIAGLLNLGAV